MTSSEKQATTFVILRSGEAASRSTQGPNAQRRPMALEDPHNPTPAAGGPQRTTSERLGDRLVDLLRLWVEARADSGLERLG